MLYWYSFVLLWSMNVTSDCTREKLEFLGENLIRQLQLRNDEAFAYLYHAYSPALFGSIKRMVKCLSTAEDLLQNVFVKIWLQIHSYSSEKGSLFTWMLSIARHEVLDYLRSKQAKKLVLTSLIHESETGSSIFIERELIRLDILKSLTFLPYKERVIIDLYKKGFTCREISQLLCLPEGTVKTKMRMSYRMLRQILV